MQTLKMSKLIVINMQVFMVIGHKNKHGFQGAKKEKNHERLAQS